MTKTTILKCLASLLLIAGLGFIASCTKDEDEPDPVALEFATTAATLAENSGAAFATVTVELAKAAAKDGTVTIAYSETNASYTTDFTTDPAGSAGEITLNVAKGATAAQFKIFAVNNALLADDKPVEFTISEVSDAFVIGAQDTYTLTLIDDEGPVTVNFTSATSSQAENNGIGADVELQLSAAAPGTGSITVTVATTAAYTTNYTTNPVATANVITIPVAAGNQNLSFKVAPVDDGDVNANRQLTFTITAASGVVNLGTAMTTHTHTITDNETPSAATFNATSSSVGENITAGVTVPITLAPQTNGAGTLVIDLSGATYGTDYTTDPAATNNKVVINVPTDATSASLKIIPVDDGDAENNRVITLTMSSGTGVVVLGANNTTHTVTIEEDDAITSIADVRGLFYPGADFILEQPIINIQGVVTSSSNNVNNRNVYIQDNTGGIQLRFTAAHTLVRGDEIKVKLNGVNFKAFNGLLQLGGDNGMIYANHVTKIGTANLPDYQTITLSQLNSGSFESRLVKVENVIFSDADGSITMSGNKTLSDGTTTVIVRTETFAPWASQVVPLGYGNMQGIASVENGVIRLIPQVSAEDIFSNNPIGSIEVTESLTDFGPVNNGSESASQSYTVRGTGLTSDITITASTGYKVSLDDATFTSSVTILAANANSSNTVYVKFTPASGVNQALNGLITHKSLGATAASVSVAGTEAGNAVSSLLMNEHFDYAIGKLTVTGTDNVSGGNWVNFSGTSNYLGTSSGNLSYTGYPTPTGNKVTMIAGTAEDAYRGFTPVTSGKVYAAFLVNVSSTTSMPLNTSTTGDYFAGFLPSNSITALDTRVTIRQGVTAGTFNIGLRATSSNPAAVFKSDDYPTGVTHLIVISYEIVAGSPNDIMKIWINPALGGAEPTEDLTQTGAAPDLLDVARFFLRQGANAIAADVDGIRVAQTWADLFN